MLKVKIPILMYHSIELMPKSTVMRSLHVPTERFKLQMHLLKLLGYRGLSLRDLKPYLDGEKKGKVVGITFDDGYKNNLLNALPILKNHNFTATCYIVSKRIGSENTWDLEQGITQNPLMSKDEIHEWIENGMDIGAHTQTHADLQKVSPEVAKAEINESKSDLEESFNIQIFDFCYPYGRLNDDVCRMVRDSGFESATTMIRGRADLSTNQLKLPRIPITHHTLPHLFLLKILSNYEDRR
jgi:peptidoglycan/xylan/chitin deacetylase (PgdA/CDA1 family)